MIRIAQAEDEEARRRELAASRLGPASLTLFHKFRIRNHLSKVSDWSVDFDTHIKFAKFTKCDNNTKSGPLAALIREETEVPFGMYADLPGKCKNLSRWRARCLNLQIPLECVMACRVL